MPSSIASFTTPTGSTSTAHQCAKPDRKPLTKFLPTETNKPPLSSGTAKVATSSGMDGQMVSEQVAMSPGIRSVGTGVSRFRHWVRADAQHASPFYRRAQQSAASAAINRPRSSRITRSNYLATATVRLERGRRRSCPPTCRVMSCLRAYPDRAVVRERDRGPHPDRARRPFCAVSMLADAVQRHRVAAIAK